MHKQLFINCHKPLETELSYRDTFAAGSYVKQCYTVTATKDWKSDKYLTHVNTFIQVNNIFSFRMDLRVNGNIMNTSDKRSRREDGHMIDLLQGILTLFSDCIHNANNCIFKDTSSADDC